MLTVISVYDHNRIKEKNQKQKDSQNYGMELTVKDAWRSCRCEPAKQSMKFKSPSKFDLICILLVEKPWKDKAE